MADTGRTVWADGFWADNFWAAALWANDAAVIVPDVVGQTQSQAATDIEALGLVVAIETAYSSTVAAGDVISQVPASGSSVAPGSTVTITVSLGDQAQNSGGYGFYNDWDREIQRRRKRLKRLKELEEEQKQIQDERDAEIAKFLQEQERKDFERDQLARLKSLALRYTADQAETEPVKKALIAAQEKLTFATLDRLSREIERQMQEEELVLLLLLSD